MSYATAAEIRVYCPSIDTQRSDAELTAYAENEETLTINPLLLKQYSAQEIAGSDIAVSLSAKLGALAALKNVYGNNANSAMDVDLKELQEDVNSTLKRLRTGEIRL